MLSCCWQDEHHILTIITQQHVIWGKWLGAVTHEYAGWPAPAWARGLTQRCPSSRSSGEGWSCQVVDTARDKVMTSITWPVREQAALYPDYRVWAHASPQTMHALPLFNADSHLANATVLLLCYAPLTGQPVSLVCIYIYIYGDTWPQKSPQAKPCSVIRLPWQAPAASRLFEGAGSRDVINWQWWYDIRTQMILLYIRIWIRPDSLTPTNKWTNLTPLA